VKQLLLFDFDRTLLDTDALKEAQAEKVATIVGLTIEQVHNGMRSYIASLQSNLDFTPAGYAQHLQLLWGVNPSDVTKIYYTDVGYIQHFLFDDTLPALSRLSKKYELGIYSESQPTYQLLRIEHSGVMDFISPERVSVLSRKREPEQLQKIPKGAILIDDDVKVIKAVLEHAQHIRLVWLNRKKLPNEFGVAEIASLADFE
jgi:hypothetical protein